MAVEGSCHCGAVRVVVPAAPEWIGSCNCSVCTRLAWLLAYYPDDGSVRIEGETVRYVWGDRMIALHHCPTCGCGTHWDSTGESHGKIGVNARLLDGFAVAQGVAMFDGAPLEVRYFDNAG